MDILDIFCSFTILYLDSFFFSFSLMDLVETKNNYKVKKGPSLIQARAYHCSAVMKIHGEEYIGRLNF